MVSNAAWLGKLTEEVRDDPTTTTHLQMERLAAAHRALDESYRAWRAALGVLRSMPLSDSRPTRPTC